MICIGLYGVDSFDTIVYVGRLLYTLGKSVWLVDNTSSHRYYDYYRTHSIMDDSADYEFKGMHFAKNRHKNDTNLKTADVIFFANGIHCFDDLTESMDFNILCVDYNKKSIMDCAEFIKLFDREEIDNYMIVYRDMTDVMISNMFKIKKMLGLKKDLYEFVLPANEVDRELKYKLQNSGLVSYGRLSPQYKKLIYQLTKLIEPGVSDAVLGTTERISERLLL